MEIHALYYCDDCKLISRFETCNNCEKKLKEMGWINE